MADVPPDWRVPDAGDDLRRGCGVDLVAAEMPGDSYLAWLDGPDFTAMFAPPEPSRAEPARCGPVWSTVTRFPSSTDLMAVARGVQDRNCLVR